MTCKELTAYEIDTSGHQLDKVFDGLKAEHLDMKLSPKAMSPREIVEHLCECYQAFVTEVQGSKHEWGSFKLEDRSWENALRTYRDLRAKAVAATMSATDDAVLKKAHDFIIGHDYYHVGQLALLRCETDPHWDPYSIYH